MLYNVYDNESSCCCSRRRYFRGGGRTVVAVTGGRFVAAAAAVGFPPEIGAAIDNRARGANVVVVRTTRTYARAEKQRVFATAPLPHAAKRQRLLAAALASLLALSPVNGRLRRRRGDLFAGTLLHRVPVRIFSHTPPYSCEN